MALQHGSGSTENLALETARQRGSVALEIADRVLEPVEPFLEGPSDAAAILLYREAVFWLLRHYCPAAGGLQEVFDAAPTSLLELTAGGDANLAQLRLALVERDSVATAECSPQEQAATARAARVFAHRLVEQLDIAPRRSQHQALAHRYVRIGTAAAAVVVIVVAAILGMAAQFRDATNLAVGRPWRTSSSLPPPWKFDPAIMFHTLEEENPWFEIDLGRAVKVRRLYVRNRLDAVQERAVPLIAEVSADHRSWTVVARREEAFDSWSPSFSGPPAQYVRLRVPRRTFLHLEKVEVY